MTKMRIHLSNIKLFLLMFFSLIFKKMASHVTFIWALRLVANYSIIMGWWFFHMDIIRLMVGCCSFI